jgi:hypothetical protein
MGQQGMAMAIPLAPALSYISHTAGDPPLTYDVDSIAALSKAGSLSHVLRALTSAQLDSQPLNSVDTSPQLALAAVIIPHPPQGRPGTIWTGTRVDPEPVRHYKLTGTAWPSE